MLLTELIHPEILMALGRAGHGAKILIADGDFPVSIATGPHTSIVHLNLMPGCVKGTEVLKALLPSVAMEAGLIMDVPAGDPEPEIWNEYEQQFRDSGHEFTLQKLDRFDFYDAVKTDDTALIIQTGETRDYANLLITMGSRW